MVHFAGKEGVAGQGKVGFDEGLVLWGVKDTEIEITYRLAIQAQGEQGCQQGHEWDFADIKESIQL